MHELDLLKFNTRKLICNLDYEQEFSKADIQLIQEYLYKELADCGKSDVNVNSKEYNLFSNEHLQNLLSQDHADSLHDKIDKIRSRINIIDRYLKDVFYA